MQNRADSARRAQRASAGAARGEGVPASERRGSGARPRLMMDEAHETRLVVWDTPPAIERGQRFAVRLGVACSARCPPAGWAVEVRDHDGELQATAALGDEPWPGTDALYHAEVALTAPDAEGLYTWEAAARTDGAGDAQASGSARFGVRIVSPPACLLTVVALDAESGAPVAGARVAAHPYRAVTDARGVAEIRVPAGEYRLFVSGRRYRPFRFEGDVQADTTIRAELAHEVELSDADLWS